MNVTSKLSNFSDGLRDKALPVVSRFPMRRQAAILIESSGRVAHIALQNGRQIVGGASTCDVIALGVSPQPAFAIDLTPTNAGSRAQIEILRDGIRLDDKQMSVGDVVPLFLGQAIRVENVVCRVQGVAGRGPKWQGRHFAAVCLLASSSIALALGLGAFSRSTQSVEASPSSFVGDFKTPVAILINELKEALRMSGLSLDVEFDAEHPGIDIGHVGQPLSLSDKAKLVNLVDAFGRRSELPLRDRTKLSSGVGSFIASVALEPARFIVGIDGRRYREGDAIAGEWKIESIAAEAITVARGEQKDELNFEQLAQPLPLHLASKNEVSVK